MKILADENIPHVHDAFATFGSVNTFVGRDLKAEQIQDTDILLVRSVSQVSANLLKNSAVKFVGTATIGLDHIDQNYLAQQKIGFASAPASNADSAAEYVLSALLIIAQQRGLHLPDLSVGIIGCGNVGSRVQQKLTTVGLSCFINDPPRQQRGDLKDGVDLDTALQCDIVSLHVPLETTGDYPTNALINADSLKTMRDDAIFINTSRGATMQYSPLLTKLQSCPNFSAILDVWPNEPCVEAELLALSCLATPHIAGYSLDGKVRATEMLYQAVCQYFDISPQWTANDSLPAADLNSLKFSLNADLLSAVQTSVLACYDVRRDDALFRKINQMDNPNAYFDYLRKNYPIHREFSCVSVNQNPDRPEWNQCFQQLGFTLSA